MSQATADSEFTLDGSVVVGEFYEDAALAGAESDRAARRFADCITHPDTDACVSVLRSTGPYSKAAQEALHDSALAAADHGITRWAVVAGGAERAAVQSRVDVDGLTVESFGLDEKDAAVEWADDA